MIESDYQVEDTEVKQFDGIRTVGELRQALVGVADDMPVVDGMGESVLVSIYRPQIQAAFIEIQ